MQAMQTNGPNPGGANWQKLLSSQALWLALILLSSGLICLLAANWMALGKWTRLLGLQALLLVVVGLAIHETWRRGMGGHRILAWMLLAAVGAGALLALVGQTYQSGAEGWQLFAWWTALILPWALTLRRPGFWLFWLVILNISLLLWLSSGHGFLGGIWRLGGSGVWQLALPNFFCLVLWHTFGARIGAAGQAVPRLLTALALLPLAYDVAQSLMQYQYSQGLGSLSVLTLAWLLASWWLWRRAQREGALDLWVLTTTALGAIGVSLALLYSVFEPDSLSHMTLVLWGGVALLESVWMAWYLLRLHERAGGGTGTIPLSVQVLLGIGAWLATLFGLLLLLLLGFWRDEFGALVLGLLLMGLGVAMLRWPRAASAQRAGRDHMALLLAQIGVAAAVAGLALSGFAFFGVFPVPWAACGLSLLAVLLYLVAVGQVLRFLAALVQIVSLVLALRWWFFFWLSDGSVGNVNVWFNWMNATAALDVRSLEILLLTGMAWMGFLIAYGQRACAAALPAALVWALVAQWLSFGTSLVPLAQLLAYGALKASLALLCALLPVLAAWSAMRALPQPVPRHWRVGLPLATLGVALLSLSVPAVLLALTWIWLGIALQRRWLRVFGSLALLLGLLDYYYSLQVSLLDKAWLQLLAGGLALVVALAVRGAAPDGTAQPVRGRSTVRRDWRLGAGLAGGLLAVLLVVNAAVIRDERILTHGKPLLLALAPVDPRALLQGDYMALAYAENRALAAFEPVPSPAFAIFPAGLSAPAGLRRVQHAALPLADDEVAVRLRRVGSEQPVLALTGAYFFAEGLAQYFESARYGEFRVDARGRAVLRQLRDAERQPMTPSAGGGS